MTERDKTDAEKLNTGLLGNESGKPVVEGTVIDGEGTDEDREPVADRASVWDDAVVSEHEPPA